MEDKDVFDYIVQSTADIASIKTTLDETLKPLVLQVNDHETRLAATQNDVRTIKRVWSSLFSVLLVSMGIVTAWVKGLFNG